MSIRILTGDCRDILPTLASESVHCVVTSPPYWGLRDYGTGQWDGGDPACDHKRRQLHTGNPVYTNGQMSKGYTTTLQAWGNRDVSSNYREVCGKCGARRVDRQIGLEATPEGWLSTMVAVFREVKRVLRADGVCWVNVGDSYATQPAGNKTLSAPFEDGAYRSNIGANTAKVAGLKPKDLLLMPARLALALQGDGWWVRSDIIWSKPNPMPESVTDRPTSAHEHVFLLTKSARYFYDADAVREDSQVWPEHAWRYAYGRYQANERKWDAPAGGAKPESNKQYFGSSSRNLRNVWSIATEAFPAAHFATFPTALVERCIRAGTSERGCCVECGAPWVRQTEARGGILGRSWHNHDADAVKGNAGVWVGQPSAEPYQRTTTGWSPSCAHIDVGTIPCTVLDPFSGAGTTLLVSDRLRRDAVGIELSAAYGEMARTRLVGDAPLLLDLAAG